MQQSLLDLAPRFDGAVYEPERDDDRLRGQMDRIYAAVKDGRWRTLAEIAELTGDPQASISAQLRHLRKRRFGAYDVQKRHLRGGTWVYRLQDGPSADTGSELHPAVLVAITSPPDGGTA